MIKKVIYLSIVNSLVFGAVTAENTVSQKETHIVVGERPLSLKKQEKIQEKRKAQEEQFSTDEKREEKGVKAAAFTKHAGAFHRPVYVSLFGEKVELEDGSLWSVHPEDYHHTLDWMTGDVILITPNHSWFASYNYVLNNMSTGEIVRVQMTLGPIYNGIYTHWIIGIDYNRGEVCLEDGSVWDISTFDTSIMNRWLPNDTIIIGTNDGWFSSYNPHILINVNVNSYANASCVN